MYCTLLQPGYTTKLTRRALARHPQMPTTGFAVARSAAARPCRFRRCSCRPTPSARRGCSARSSTDVDVQFWHNTRRACPTKWWPGAPPRAKARAAAAPARPIRSSEPPRAPPSCLHCYSMPNAGAHLLHLQLLLFNVKLRDDLRELRRAIGIGRRVFRRAFRRAVERERRRRLA